MRTASRTERPLPPLSSIGVTISVSIGIRNRQQERAQVALKPSVRCPEMVDVQSLDGLQAEDTHDGTALALTKADGAIEVGAPQKA